jgi:CheY-like chemotaxis protein
MVEAAQIGMQANVLLVEDEPLIGDAVAQALEEQGFAVETVLSAEEAVCRLTDGASIDLLFTDLCLPGSMDGAALARRARQMRPDLPVIYTSGRQQMMEHLDPVEGAMFLPKPYDLFKLGRLLQYLIVAKRTRAGAFA